MLMGTSRPTKRLHLGRGRRAGWVRARAVPLVASHFFDEPIRRDLEAKLNQHLRGYSVRLGHAHAGLFGLSVSLRDLVVRQDANPEPPVAMLPSLLLHLDWPGLLRVRLVGEA